MCHQLMVTLAKICQLSIVGRMTLVFQVLAMIIFRKMFLQVKSLMQKVTEPGKYANWIAPPPKGINGNPIDFEYVRL